MADRVGQSFGNYQLLRLLGSGAFADVYLAEHRYLEIPAAIKVLYVRLEPHTQEQFLREARTIAHLQHPHIVRVLDFGFQDETPYLVIEYSPNGTLRSRHPKGTRLSLEQVIHYVKQIAPALDYAHQQRVIHRDIKPENLLLNANDEVVLSDFGIAVVQQSRDTLLKQNQAGTPIYMAPEQIQGKPTAASDQYALGVLVYEWLCGEPPFRGTLFEVLSQHLHEPPPSLCNRVTSLPFAVEDAVFGALAKEPQARFVSVQDFADVLEEVCDSTQQLSLDLSSAPLSPEPFSPPAAASADSTEEPDRSLSPTQTLVVARTYAEDKEERVASSQLEAAPLSQTNRQHLLKRVRAFWIAGVLEHSLHGTNLVALGLEEQSDAVANPWQLVLHHLAGAPRSLPAGVRITEVYDEADGELLILGAPGSGKTTLLLELARDLLERAERNKQHPLPVVFTLSSWAIKQQPLADWLIEELSSTYQVPRKLGQALVEADQILPLLDGLDEVAAETRMACIEVINTYRQKHGLLPLVVCSRSADYLAQTARLQLITAVAVQPLTPQQVDDSLARGGEPLRALRVALLQDAALRELANSPLMLSILSLTYLGMPVEELLREASLTERQRQVFERYVERMLRHRGAATRYMPGQTTHWLSWLARQMKQQNQSVFYIEHLQPDWLSGNRMPRAYHWLAVLLPGMLMGVLVSLSVSEFIFGGSDPPTLITSIVIGGLLGGLLSEGNTPLRPTMSGGKARSAHGSRLLQRLLIGALIGLGSGLSYGLSAGLSAGLSVGLGLGLCSILLQLLFGKINTAEARYRAPPPAAGATWQRLISRREIHNGLLIGLLIGLSVGLSYGLSYGVNFVGLNVGLCAGLSFGLLSILLRRRNAEVQPTDRLVWSWRSLGKNLFSKSHASTSMQVTALIELSIGLSIALAYGLFSGLNFLGLSARLSSGLNTKLLSVLLSGLLSGLILGLIYWLLLGLFQGVSSVTIEDQLREVPNGGIRRSALNGLVLGLISTLIVGLLCVLSVGLRGGLAGLSVELREGLPAGLLAGLSAGLFAGLLNGGLASLRHYILRFLLWHTGSVPWHYVPFLDYAAECILLRKVGGGYIFIHRLLLEYFASLNNA